MLRSMLWGDEEPIRAFTVVRNDGEDTLLAGEVLALDDLAVTYADGMDKAILYKRGFKVRVDEDIPYKAYGKLELLFDSN